MQFFQYQTWDGYTEVAPCNLSGLWVCAIAHVADSNIMMARMRAAKRGAKPAFIQRVVMSLDKA